MSFQEIKTPVDLENKEKLLSQLIPQKLPCHVAIIMDGNGRWALRRGLPRLAGHQAGRQSIKEIVQLCGKLSPMKVLTFYVFSTENQNRPSEEVAGLMDLLVLSLREEVPELLKNNVRLMTIGKLEGLAISVREELERGIVLTRANSGLILNLAINYGGRAEIIDAIKKLLQTRANGQPIDNIDENLLEKYLYTNGLPPLDFLIRTGGEQRLSNFLLWQCAYTELWFTQILWPDFRGFHFLQALLDYQKRKRRFGQVS